MRRANLRLQPRINYYESEVPEQDYYVFCADCGDFVYEYCTLHGPLLVIPDDKVSTKHPLISIVPRAALTVPRLFLHLARSVIPGAGIGVFSTLTLPRGVRFGPYTGVKTNEINSTYCWQIYNGSKPSHVIDAADANRSNWMRYVNCSRHWCEQNLVAYQYQGQIFYRTVKVVPPFTELMVYYGSEFANLLDVDLKRYNSVESYSDIIGTIQRDTDQQNIICRKDLPNIFVAYRDAGENPIKTSNSIVPIEENNTNSFQNINLNKYVDKRNIQTQEFVTTFISTNTGIKRGIVNEKRFSCDKCSFKTSHYPQLIGHFKAHAASKSFDCDFCPYKARHYYSLKRHTKQHIGIQKYNCSICHKRFANESLLNIHLRSHSVHTLSNILAVNERKDYVNNNENTNVVSVENTVGRLSCHICPYKTSTEVQLASHLKAHSSNKSFDCDLCPYKTLKKYSLGRHMMTHLGILNVMD